jgi:DNA-binding NarL/FixJ family response regulator
MTVQMMKWQLEEWIRDYNFLLREISRLERILNKVSFGGSSLVAQYGMEAAMPKGSRGISQAELNELDSREKRLFRYTEIVNHLEKAEGMLDNEKYRVVYDCMLEGMSYRSIAKHLGVSRDTIYKMKEEILELIAQKGQKDHIQQLLKLEKVSV